MSVGLHYLAGLCDAVTPESKHFMAGLLMAAVLIAGIAVELVLVARWFKWPY